MDKADGQQISAMTLVLLQNNIIMYHYVRSTEYGELLQGYRQ